MSNINGAPGSHYISNAAFLEWMQTKTDGLYGKMSDAMDVSNDRADAEDALNTIKSKIADVQAGNGDPNELYALVNETIAKYGDEFSELKSTLDSISHELHAKGAVPPDGTEEMGRKPYIPPPPPPQITLSRGGSVPNPAYEKWEQQWGVEFAKYPDMVIRPTPAKVTIEEDTATRWTNAIKDRVDDFSKQDQLGLINIQEFNAQLNQAKQMASALMDSSDKAANTIIGHIS